MPEFLVYKVLILHSPPVLYATLPKLAKFFTVIASVLTKQKVEE